MTTMILNTFAAASAAIGIALSSLTGNDNPYEGRSVEQLTEFEAASHALHVFMRADWDGDQTLNVDEYTTLSIVTAELAHLNGFISIDNGGAIRTIALPMPSPSAVTASEHVRIDAVARHTFYAFAGDDGQLDAGEYVSLQQSLFNQADLNGNGSLADKELISFAQRQAQLSTGV